MEFFKKLFKKKKINNYNLISNSEIFREEFLYPLFGNQNEWKELFMWEKNELSNDFKKSYEKIRLSNHPLYVQLYWCLVRKEQDQQKGIECTEFYNVKINNILSYERHIHISNSSNEQFEKGKCECSYSSGNFIRKYQIPELLIFFPIHQTNSYLINTISEYFIDQKLLPLQKHEIRQVKGLIGKNGELSFRLRLLEDLEKRETISKYQFQIPYEAEVILVDVPDLKGNYSHEDDCDEYVKDNIPEEFRIKKFTSEKNFPLRDLPISKNSFLISLKSNVEHPHLFQEKYDNEFEFNRATNLTIEKIIISCDPKNILNKNDDDYWKQIINIKKEITRHQTCRNWLEAELNKDSSFRNNEEIEEILKEVDFSMVALIVDIAWEQACLKETIFSIDSNNKLLDSYEKNNFGTIDNDFIKTLLIKYLFYYERLTYNFEESHVLDNEKAQEYLNKAIELNKEKYFLLCERGNLKNDPTIEDDIEGALDDFNNAIRLNPNKDLAYLERAKCYKQEGDIFEPDSNDSFFKAIDDFTTVISINPKNADAYHYRGECKAKLENLEGAIDDFSKAIEIDPQDKDPFKNRGWAKENLKDFSGAIEDYTKAIEIDPEDPIYSFRGIAKLKIEDYQGAIDDFSKAIHLNSDDSRIYNMRGQAKDGLKDYQGAIKDFSIAIRIDPENPANYSCRGFVKEGLKDYQGAIDDWKIALELGNEDAAKLIEKYE